MRQQLCLLIATVLLSACSSFSGTITEKTKYHMINIAEDGNVYPSNPGTYYYIFDEIDDEKKVDSLSSEYNSQLEEIISKFKKSEKKKILLFIHGGLNTFEGSVERVKDNLSSIEDDGIFPIFVNWRSGGVSSYWEHLTKIRDGEETNWAYATALPYFLSDILQGVAIAPVAYIEQGWAAFEDSALREDERKVCEFDPENFLGALDCPIGSDRGWGTAIGQSTYWWSTSAPKLVTTPFVYSFGKPAWDIMNRRARTMFFRPCEFTHDCRLDSNTRNIVLDYEKYYKGQLKQTDLSNACLSRIKYETAASKKQSERFFYEMCSGALSVFMSKLTAEFCKNISNSTEICDLKLNGMDITIDVVGHSMGAIVIGELLKSHSYFKFDNVAFMGAAISGREAIDSLGPYMMKHKDTHFYNLMLHPKNEDLESSYGVLPSGSLLNWIDTMYGLPETEFDLTFGRWRNVRKQVSEFPPEIACRMYFKVFGFDDTEPTQHGEFDDTEETTFEFWDKTHWFTNNEESKNKSRDEHC